MANDWSTKVIHPRFCQYNCLALMVDEPESPWQSPELRPPIRQMVAKVRHTLQWWHLSGLNLPHHLQCLARGTPKSSTEKLGHLSHLSHLSHLRLGFPPLSKIEMITSGDDILGNRKTQGLPRPFQHCSGSIINSWVQLQAPFPCRESFQNPTITREKIGQGYRW
jgi:hypothetical protein